MEQECKYRLTAAAYAAMLDAAPPMETVTMAAVYYDTPDAALHSRGISLRLRQENGVSVVCVKSRPAGDADVPPALKIRQETECPAASVAEAIPVLREHLEPAVFAALTEALPRLEITGKLEYTRHTALLQIPGTETTAHLCLDAGCFGTEPFRELELELASGALEPLLAYAAALEGRYGLVPETRSKQARAIAAWKNRK